MVMNTTRKEISFRSTDNICTSSLHSSYLLFGSLSFSSTDDSSHLGLRVTALEEWNDTDDELMDELMNRLSSK